MSEKTQKRHADLRARITDAAETAVIGGGISAIKARDLAREAGCALGAIYTVFDDMTDIVLAVNSRTFSRLGQAVTAAVEAQDTPAPGDQLIVMAKAYLRFAADNAFAWRSLFDVEMSTDKDVPEWYFEEMSRLLKLIADPLATLRPDLPKEEVFLLARAMFSSVHGIVLLGLEKRISGVPLPDIERMIETILRNFAGSS